MGADCSSDRAPGPRSVRPSPVVSSAGVGRERRSGGRQRTSAKRSNGCADDELNFDFEFDYDLASLSSVKRPKRTVHEKNRRSNNGISGGNATRGDPEPSLSSSSDESGCSGNHSLIGYVPQAKLQRWLDDLPSDPADFSPLEEKSVWSDGERESRQWLHTEASVYFDGSGLEGPRSGSAGGARQAPTYVMALGMQSDGEREELAERQRLQRERQQQHRQKAAKKKKTQVSRCA